MSFWTAAVVIVAIFAYMNLRRGRHDAPMQGGIPSSSPELEREVEELRRRVETLERILTDNRGTADLAQQIEALRDR